MQPNSEYIFDEILPIIDQWLKFQIYKFQVPGTAVGILYEDKIIFKKEYGFAHHDIGNRLSHFAFWGSAFIRIVAFLDYFFTIFSILF
ncbi:MAG: hypothetical protein EU530_00790 [Promethearchaeota archaeon]|nr:MAG: hypothetical protein EU530_00790 [Candidatus Lokiarchaeota archaeon]